MRQKHWTVHLRPASFQLGFCYSSTTIFKNTLDHYLLTVIHLILAACHTAQWRVVPVCPDTGGNPGQQSRQRRRRSCGNSCLEETEDVSPPFTPDWHLPWIEYAIVQCQVGIVVAFNASVRSRIRALIPPYISHCALSRLKISRAFSCFIFFFFGEVENKKTN